MRFSTSVFFHQIIPSGPLIHVLKPFLISYLTKLVAQRCQWPAVANTADSAMQTLFKSTKSQQCNLHHCGNSGVKDTAVPMDLEFERLWLPLKGILIKQITSGNCTIL
jgi:hypothetical protein